MSAPACRSALFLTGGYTLAAFAGVAFMAVHNVAEGLNFVLGVAAALLIFGLGALLSFVARENVDQTVGEWFGVWALAGTRNLRRTFQVRHREAPSTIHLAMRFWYRAKNPRKVRTFEWHNSTITPSVP